MIDDTQLASTLIQEGVLDQATVERCKQDPRTAGIPLYEALLRGRHLAERDLVGVVARLLDVPTHDVVAQKIPGDVRAMVPASLAHRNRVVPLARGRRGELLLGMSDPRDQLAVDEIATHAGVEVRPVLVGPGALAAALRVLYPDADKASDVADAVLDAFDDFEVGDYLDEAMPGNEWSDYFADDPSEVEDSSVLSREMQDRPSTDVLRDEDVDAATAEAQHEEDLPEIEIIEELGQPIRRRPPSPYASLDSWEVDAAIDGSSEIVSAQSAGDLFGTPTGASARVEPEEEEAEPTSNLAPEDIEPHTDALETQSSKTSVGVGVKELSQDVAGGTARPQKKARLTVENTGLTEIGMGPKSVVPPDDEPDAKIARKPSAAERRLSDESTDYGALGRAILKSGPESPPARKPTPAPTSKAPAHTLPPPDDTSPVRAGDDKRPTSPRPLVQAEQATDDEADEPKAHTSVVVALFEDDDEPPAPVKAPKIIPPPQDTTPEPPLAFALPEDIDARSLAHALANLLVQKGLLTADEITALALRFSEGDDL